MTLLRTRAELSQSAIDDDLQSITGVWLEGFRTDFSDLIEATRRLANSGRLSRNNRRTWRTISEVLTVVYGSGPRMARDIANSVGTRSNEPIVRLLSSELRDYTSANYLLGFGASDQNLDELLRDVRNAFGLSRKDVSRRRFKESFVDLLVALVQNSQFRYSTSSRTFYDDRSSKLYLKLDLSEWIRVRNSDIRHVVIEPAQSLDGYYPLGRTTIWLPARAQIRHVRSKTSKTFLRGQIARQLKIEDLEENVSNFLDTIFDTDSEQAYSSSSSPC